MLRDAGLVNAEKEGQFMRYELATTVFQDVLEKLAAWTQPLPIKSHNNA